MAMFLNIPPSKTQNKTLHASRKLAQKVVLESPPPDVLDFSLHTALFHGETSKNGIPHLQSESVQSRQAHS